MPDLRPPEAGPPRAEPAGAAGPAYAEAVGILVLLVLYAAMKAAFGILICDDAYITLGHARSWVSGLGPVMSAQNPVAGTSTPLFTALLALASLSLGTSDFERLAYGANVLADLAGLLLLHRIARKGLGLPAAWALGAAAAYGLSVNFLAVSAYGMETPLYAALALAAAWLRLFSARPFPWLFPVCLLAACLRPEGGLVAAMALAAGWFRDAREPRPVRVRRAALVCLAAGTGLLLYFLFYLHAYGHILPHSVLAKRLEIRVGPGEALWSWVANVFYKGPAFGGFTTATLANLLFLGAAAAGHLRPASARVPAFPWSLLLWPAAYFLFYLATRSSYILFTWYYLPVLPFLILLAVHGLFRLSDGRMRPWQAWAVLFAFAAWVSFQTFRQDLPGKHRLSKAAREDRYEAAAAILNAQPGPAPEVMIDEVGALAYFSRAKILDTHGLLSPEALPFLAPDPESHWDRLAALREKENPDWIVGLREAFLEDRFLPGEERVYHGYRRARILRVEGHGYNLEMWSKSARDDSTRFASRLRPAAR